MAKRKREGQTTQWPKEKEKDRQHNGIVILELPTLPEHLNSHSVFSEVRVI
jgi:hypothetical protein